MNKEEAIKAIQDFIGWFKPDSRIYKALKMAIKALSQEPCDAISRDALITKLEELIKTSRSTIEIKAKLIPMIRDMPSVTQKSGHWKQIIPAGVYECNICGQNVMTQDIVAYKYCHGCGAKMESEE